MECGVHVGKFCSGAWWIKAVGEAHSALYCPGQLRCVYFKFAGVIFATEQIKLLDIMFSEA